MNELKRSHYKLDKGQEQSEEKDRTKTSRKNKFYYVVLIIME